MTIADHDRCPCGSGFAYGECCARYHRGASAPTAEALMRSRYTAFALHNADYLLRTWHPDTRPEHIGFDIPLRFTRLEILSTSAGGPLDSTGTVDFEAFYRIDGSRGSQREHSTFIRLKGEWFYHSEG